MNIDDPIFTNLALKVLANKASAEERSQLKEMVAKDPALEVEYKEMQKDFVFAKEVLPLMGEVPEKTPAMPEHIRHQLRDVVSQQAKADERDKTKSSRSWRWLWGLATATAVIAIIVIVGLPTQKATVQFAMLDSMGTVRGTNADVTVKLVAALQENFGQTNFMTCSGAQELKLWLDQWPATGRTLKLVYDRDNGVVRIMSRVDGITQVVKTFVVAKEEDLPSVLKEASEAIRRLEKEIR
jgi:hypothetical protein